ncbi:MAG TPA: alpha/beta hydrolase, partial [Planctomycetes bacterium]|nr:alpha/beta hydrolase [Planctomycetota bacterium]
MKSSSLLFLSLFFPLPAAGAQTPIRFRDPVFSRVNVAKAVPYGAAVNRYTRKMETLLMDIYTPKGDTLAKRPAVVIVHGGGWVSGSRASFQFVRMAKDFALRGYVAASIDYRMAPSKLVRKLPESAEDSQEDTKAAVRFLRRYASRYGVDPGRIAAAGGSAGGFAVVMASYYKEEGKSGNPGWSSKIQ